MKEEKPDALVCIDYPGFNMKLIEKAKKAGIPVIYYILPTIWAWHKSRGNVIAEYTDLAVSLFPFEAEMYKKMGTNVVYGGHPLLDTVKPSMSKDEAYSFFGLQQGKKTVLFMPGSRVQEVQSLYGKMLAAGKLLQDKVEGLQFMVPKASTIDRHMLEEAAREANLEVHIGEERVYDMMNIADAAICASGTATLETALMGVPTLLVYRVNALTYWLSKILVHLDSIGLPNIISGHRIMPELWQDEVTPENIEAAVLPWLVDAAAAEEARHLMAGVRCQMGEAGAVRRTAEIISEFVKEKQLHEAVQ